jgi:hypothetical protein
MIRELLRIIDVFGAYDRTKDAIEGGHCQSEEFERLIHYVGIEDSNCEEALKSLICYIIINNVKVEGDNREFIAYTLYCVETLLD